MSALETQLKKRSRARKLAYVLFFTLAVLVIAIEIGSRYADTVEARRTNDPDRLRKMLGPNYELDVVDKLSFGVLEYGTIKRAQEQGKARTGPHPYLGYAMLPNFETPPGAPQQVRHNALGFRGKETTWEKPPGVYRIVTTGGSSVYGQTETCDAAVWSQRLEDYLNAGGGGRKFEVVNTGCSGWSSFEMLINLELRALDLQPDLVIVYEAINDMRCALYTSGGEPVRDNTHWRAPWQVDRPSEIEAFLTRSRTYMLWRRYATDYIQRRTDLAFVGVTNFASNRGDTYVHSAAGLPIPERGFENYRRNLNDIIAVCEARGAQVLCVTQALPRWHLDDKPESKEDQWASFERIRAIEREVAGKHGVKVFECAQIVEKALDDELIAERARQRSAHPDWDDNKVEIEARAVVRTPGKGLFRNEVHPNDSGSDLIAKLISEYMLGTFLAK